jgi:hypothetical protein
MSGFGRVLNEPSPSTPLFAADLAVKRMLALLDVPLARQRNGKTSPTAIACSGPTFAKFAPDTRR